MKMLEMLSFKINKSAIVIMQNTLIFISAAGTNIMILKNIFEFLLEGDALRFILGEE